MFEWEEYFKPHILERGRNYARNGAVQHITKKGNVIEAVVAGSEYYKVNIRYFVIKASIVQHRKGIR